MKSAQPQRDGVMWWLLRFGQAELRQFFSKPLAPVLATAKCPALPAQAASPAQVVGIFRANKYAHVFEVAAFAHSVANRASAHVEAEDKAVEEICGRSFQVH